MTFPNSKFVEMANIISGVPLDTQGASGLSTPYVSMKNYRRAVVVLTGAAGTGSDAAIITLLQASAVAGTGEKALNVTEFWAKSGADLKAVGTFTRSTQAAGNTVTGGVITEQKCVVVDITDDMFDTANGFDCLKVTVADTGAAGAQLGLLQVILMEPRIRPVVSPLAD
jgi:hypothetical protein